MKHHFHILRLVVLLLLFFASVAFLVWDHKKYGVKTPPKWVAIMRDISLVLLVLCSFTLTYFMLKALFKESIGHSDENVRSSAWARLFICLLVLSWLASCLYYAYGRKLIEKKYENKGKMPAWLDGLHKATMWYSLIGIIIILVIWAMIDPHGLSLFMMGLAEMTM